MRIAVLSDLHLGIRDRAERFGHDQAAFERFLDALERAFDVIILNGDTWETWQGERFADTRAAWRAARRAWDRLGARFEREPYRLTWGNHDPLLADEGVPRQLTLEADGLRLLFTHGHEWDPPLKRIGPLAYAFSWSTAWMVRREERPAVRAINRLRGGFERRHLYNPRLPPRLDALDEASCPYLRGAAAWLREHPRVDVIALGHTHVPARVETPWGLVLNSGAAAGGRYAWIAADTARRAFHVFEHEPDVARALDALDAASPAAAGPSVER